MSALDPPRPPPPAARLAELLMSAAETLTDGPAAALPAPTGIPVRAGRLHVARARHALPPDGPITVVAGFGTACWLGAPGAKSPSLGRLTYRTVTSIDPRGRVMLDRQVRAWLTVTDPAAFEAVPMPMPEGGVLVVPVENFARRFEAVTT